MLVLPPLLYLGGLLVALALHWLRPLAFFQSPLRFVLALALFAGAVALRAWAHRVIARTGTNVDPRKPATALMTDGPYARTRNPLYLALSAAFLAIGLAVNDSWFIAVLVAMLLVMHFAVIRREESYLLAKFGEPYAAYCRLVRRWL